MQRNKHIRNYNEKEITWSKINSKVKVRGERKVILCNVKKKKKKKDVEYWCIALNNYLGYLFGEEGIVTTHLWMLQLRIPRESLVFKQYRIQGDLLKGKRFIKRVNKGNQDRNKCRLQIIESLGHEKYFWSRKQTKVWQTMCTYNDFYI